ncbi:DUF5710 domain-containing protein [uncultured Roseibium sp.]|uniref:DUF5710 domain-containing protein n=1 Tax=uncultured Roseibium sp. TaxID=1936171 RepID=UPI003216AEC6
MAGSETVKTYLTVPFAEKDEAKAAGALWDKKTKAWFAKGADVPEGLKKFLPANQPEPSQEDPRAAFAQFLARNGAVLDRAPIMDGKWHRVALVGDGKETNATYRGFLDGVPNGQFKNFKGDEAPVQWIGKGKELSREEKQRLSAETAQAREIRERERVKEQEAAAKRAFGIWTNLTTWGDPGKLPLSSKKTGVWLWREACRRRPHGHSAARRYRPDLVLAVCR